MQMDSTAPRSAMLLDARSARRLLIAEYGNFCFRCLRTPTDDEPQLTTDHIIPKARGGLDVYQNYQLLCRPCNGIKYLQVIDYRPGTRQLDLTREREFIPLNQRTRRESPTVDDEGYQWVSLPEAVRLLGIAETTLRRMIRDGKLEAEAEPREPGTSRIRYRVRIPNPPESSDDAPEAPQTYHNMPPAAIDVQAIIETVTGPLVATLTEERAERQRLSTENAELRERAGRAEASIDLVRSERDAARRDVDAAQDARVQAEDERDASRMELSSALVEIATLRSDRDAIRAERERLAADLAQARAKAARPWWRVWRP